MFPSLLLKNEKNISDSIFRNEGPGFWVKKTILAVALQGHRDLSPGFINLFKTPFFFFALDCWTKCHGLLGLDGISRCEAIFM